MVSQKIHLKVISLKYLWANIYEKLRKSPNFSKLAPKCQKKHSKMVRLYVLLP